MSELNEVLELTRLSLQFGRIERATLQEDGKTPETDSTHTVMLGVIACTLANRWYSPHRPRRRMNVGLVAQYALVHDLVEVYAGDTSTLRITPEQLAQKADREAAALARLEREFGPAHWLSRVLTSYERRSTSEARFVRAVDKLLPKLTHLLNDCEALRAQGVTTEELTLRLVSQRFDIESYAGEFTELLALYDEAMVSVLIMLDGGVTAEAEAGTGRPVGY